MKNLSPPVRVVLVYVLLSLAWLILSSLALAGRPAWQALGYLAFVTLVAAVLYVDRRRVETACRAGQDARQALLDAAPEAVFFQSLAGQVLDCNAAACALYGYARQELLGLPLAELVLEGTGADGRQNAAGKRKDGSLFPAEINTRTVTIGGQQLAVTYIYDPTSHKQAEERLRQAETRYRALVEQIPAVIYIDATDALSSAVYMSPEAERMLGYTADEWIQDPGLWVKLLHADDRERVLAENARTNATGEPFIEEYRLHARNGRIVWVRDVAVLVRGEAGQPPFWQGVMLDITERKQAEEELRAQKQLFENLVAVARATTERPTMEATLQNALNVAASLTGAEHGDLFLLDREGNVTYSTLAYGEMTAERRRRLVTSIMDQGLAGWVARNRQAALIADVSRDERWLTFPELPLTRSVLSVPILSGPALVGVLTLFHSQAGHFEAEHLKLMQAAADQMALAVRNAQIFDAQRRQASRQATLYEVLSAISRQLDPHAVARVAVEATVRFAGWPHVAIATPDEGRACIIVRAASGPLSPSLGLTFPVEQGVVGRAFVTGQLQLVPDVQADPDYVAVHPAIRSELVVPLRRGEQTLGVLNVESDQPDAFDEDDVLLAGSLADAIVLALENGRLFQAMQDERSRLEALIESSRDGILLVGMDGRVLVMNEPARHLLRLPGQPADWLGRGVGDVLLAFRRHAPGVVKSALAEMRRLQSGDEPLAEGEYELPPRIIHSLNLPVLAGTAPLGHLLVLRDVTQERALEQLREDMTHTMVHDLRSPLGAMVTGLALLSEDVASSLSPAHQHVLDIISGNGQKLLGLINGILDVRRLESARMPISRAPFQLAGLVADVLEAQSPLMVNKAQRLECDVPPDLPPAWADAELIGRVLQNLVGNAIKFTPAGGAIRVAARVESRLEQPVLLVSVSDSGPGIPAEIQSRVFEKFVTGGQPGRGSGLGLAFCKAALEAHGDRIWVDSTPEHGTTFTFTLGTAQA